MSKGGMARPGAYALSLLATPLNLRLLRALQTEPRSVDRLREAVDSPSAVTLRTRLAQLVAAGVVDRRRQRDFPRAVELTLSRSGMKLLRIQTSLDDWLEGPAAGTLHPDPELVGRTVKALIDGWSADIVRALAARSLSLTELHRYLPRLSYPTLERRVRAMRQAGLIEQSQTRGPRGAPYRVTPLLRFGVAPLTAAISWEQRCLKSEAPPIGKADVEATFLLAVPMLDLPRTLSGSCRLTVELEAGSGSSLAGVFVTVDRGKVSSCVTRLQGEPDAWASGTPLDWFRLVRDRDDHRVEIGGAADLALAVVAALRDAVVPTSGPWRSSPPST